MTSKPLLSTALSAGTWVSHLRQFIDRTVIQPHIITAGDVLGARAVPCNTAPLLGVAWAILDAPQFYRESAVAILQVVKNSVGVGPGRYAAWCLLDCCARVASKKLNSNNNSAQNKNSNAAKLQQQFLEEIERSLPALVTTHMPLSGVADPTIIDVDEEDSQEAVRIKARLERRCFRRLYLEILNGWIRDPWFVSGSSSSSSSISSSAGGLQRQLVEHVVLALCGGNNNKNNSSSNGSTNFGFEDFNNKSSEQNNRNNTSSQQQQNLFSPEYFVKTEPGMLSASNGNNFTTGNSNNQNQTLAAVKREGGGSASSLSSETLSKVLDLVYATSNTTTKASAPTASTSTSSAPSFRKHESTSGASTIERFFDAANNTNMMNAAKKKNEEKTSSTTTASMITSKDLLEDTRRQVASIVNELNELQRGNANSKMFKCSHCGTVFPKEEARNAHALTHFPSRATTVEERQTGQKQLLHRLPPPSQEDFINYLGDAQSGSTATLYVTDSEYQSLLGYFKVQQQNQQQQHQNQQAKSTPLAFGNHPKLVERFSNVSNVTTSAVGKLKKVLLAEDAASSTSSNDKLTGSQLVFVKDPLTKRACFKCAKVFEPKEHPTRGWYLDECIEAINPQDGQVGFAHKHCVF